MANISELIFTNTTNPRQTENKLNIDENYYFVKYLFPLFWLACFTTDDIHKFEALEDEEYKYYYFMATRDKCLEIFQSRLPLIDKLYQGHLNELANQFVHFIRRKTSRYIIVRIDEVLGMEIDPGGDDAKAEMIRLLSVFDNNAELPEYVRLEHLGNDREYIRFGLDGFGSDVLPVPSFDNWLRQQYPVIEATPKNSSKDLYFYLSIFVIVVVLFSLAAGLALI